MAFNLQLFLCGLLFMGLPSCAQKLSPIESPVADAKIICSPTNPNDCYPQIFQPTHEFQTIREGQDIPPGLHVRMDIYSGVKEARINTETAQESGNVEGIPDAPTERAVIIVPQEQTGEEQESKKRPPQETSIKPPKYEEAGKIKPPSPSESHESEKFQDALDNFKSETTSFDRALDDLSELSHDIYYGLVLAKDASAIEKLVCMTVGLGSNNSRGRKAAAILASALQNNPTALSEVGKIKDAIMKPSCIGTEGDQEDFIGSFRVYLEQEEDADTLRTKVRALSGLLKEPSIRDSFLQDHGMELLLAVFLKKGKNFDVVRKKVGELLSDNFLDASLGAKLNIWPKNSRSPKSVCEDTEQMFGDGCWEHHIEVFSRDIPAEEWPKQLLLAFVNHRPGQSSQKSEL